MKHTTAPLAKNLEKPRGIARFLVRRILKNGHYSARHLEKDIRLLWAEAERLGQLVGYPSAIMVDGALHVFRPGAENKEQNDEMIRLWNAVVSPKTFEREFSLKVLDEGEYDALYLHCRDHGAWPDNGNRQSP